MRTNCDHISVLLGQAKIYEQMTKSKHRPKG